jgi:hypothetical protein
MQTVLQLQSNFLHTLSITSLYQPKTPVRLLHFPLRIITKIPSRFRILSTITISQKRYTTRFCPCNSFSRIIIIFSLNPRPEHEHIFCSHIPHLQQHPTYRCHISKDLFRYRFLQHGPTLIMANGSLPENIIIYRDGVSEGQYRLVID